VPLGLTRALREEKRAVVEALKVLALEGKESEIILRIDARKGKGEEADILEKGQIRYGVKWRI
jgi:hypothetical protein